MINDHNSSTIPISRGIAGISTCMAKFPEENFFLYLVVPTHKKFASVHPAPDMIPSQSW